MGILEKLENRDENFILKRMLKNIAFFHSNSISKALQSTLEGKNTKYQLYFSSDDINIIDLENKTFLYPKNAFLSSQVNLSITPLNNPLYKIYSNNLSLNKIESKNTTQNGINKIIDIANIASSDTSLYHLPPLFLPQVNIFGLGGGIFLELLCEAGYNFHSLLVYEESIELFAISCYFIDYERLFSHVSPKSCYIFIEGLLKKELLNHYFYTRKITNNFLYLELNVFKSQRIEQFRNITYEAYKANARGWGSFEDEIIGFKNTMLNIKEARFLNLERKLNVPICVVGSGASLESSIPFLKANQSKMLIFSCGTALKVLKKHNIKIDLQIEIERIPYLPSVLLESNLDSTPLLCANVVDNNVLKIAKEAYLFLRGGSASSYIFDKPNVLEFCSPLVGNAGFSIACSLSDEIILCGMDCGYIKGYAKHAKGSYYGDEEVEIPKDCYKVAGNSSLEVYANSLFSLSKEAFSLAIAHYKPKRVYNLSLGAFIKGSISTKNVILKDDIAKANIFKILDSNASLKPNMRDLMLRFILELKEQLDCDIKSKRELFIKIDALSAFLAKQSVSNPSVGILFEGSISHLLQYMMICLLSVKSDDILDISRECIKIILEVLESFKLQILEIS